MKTLALYFLKRWWWVYLITFLISIFVAASSAFSVSIETVILIRCFIAYIPVFAFWNYHGKGGQGTFWLPLTRQQIGRVHWMIAVLWPTLIFMGAGFIGTWLADLKTMPSVGVILKHGLFSAGLMSLMLYPVVRNMIWLSTMVSAQRWRSYIPVGDTLLEAVGLILSILLVGMTFRRSESYLVKLVRASTTPTATPLWQGLSKHSKKTGMTWLFNATIGSIIKSFLLITLLLVTIQFLTNSSLKGIIPIITIVLVMSASPISLLIANLRVSRSLPFSGNQLAGWLVGLTVAVSLFISLLLGILVIALKIPLGGYPLIFLFLLEGVIISQIAAFFVSAKGLQGAGAILAILLILSLMTVLFVFLKIYTEPRLILAILISLPLSFFVHRYCLRSSSALYRPQKEEIKAF